MSNAPENKADLGRRPSRLRVALAFAGMFWGFGALLFLPAGRLDWPAGWLYLAIVMIYMAINYAYLSRKNPELIASRMRLGKYTKTWDKIWMGGFMPVYIAVFVVAALDAGRFGWSPLSPFLWPVGLALFLPGAMLLSWSMGVNPFFEKTVRIQTERGHRVIDTGPYRFVRHPGYVGIVGWILSAPLMLGSWWAFLPAVLTVVALVVRTGLEDRTLREELSGYTEYAARVRYRLVPKLW